MVFRLVRILMSRASKYSATSGLEELAMPPSRGGRGQSRPLATAIPPESIPIYQVSVYYTVFPFAI